MKAPQITITVDVTDVMIAVHSAAISILDLRINHTTGRDKIDAMAERSLHEIELMGSKARKELCS